MSILIINIIIIIILIIIIIIIIIILIIIIIIIMIIIIIIITSAMYLRVHAHGRRVRFDGCYRMPQLTLADADVVVELSCFIPYHR